MALSEKEKVEAFFDYDFDLPTRTVYLGDESDEKTVGPNMAAKFLKALHLLHADSRSVPITILMNTIGGCVYSGMAIYDGIKASPCHVNIQVVGSAMSMGAFILQAADERIMYPSAVLMLHDGTESIDAPARTFENWAEYSRIVRKQSYHILAERTGKTPRYWEKRCADDYILDAKQALAENLIDRIASND